MIPRTIGRLENVPLVGYSIKEEMGIVSVYLHDRFIAEITIDNLLELFKTVAFSSGVANSNLLVFIRDKDDRLKLIRKNSKEYRQELKAYEKIKNLKVLDEIEFVSSNIVKKGTYLGKAYYNKEEVYAILLEIENIYITKDMTRIEVISRKESIDTSKEYAYSRSQRGFIRMFNPVNVILEIPYIEKERLKNRKSKIKGLKSININDLTSRNTKLFSLKTGDFFNKLHRGKPTMFSSDSTK